MKKHVSYLQISMDDVFFSQIIQSFEDIFDDWLGFILVEISFLPQSWFQVTFITQLCDDIAISIAGEDLIALEHIGVIKLFEDVNLWEK